MPAADRLLPIPWICWVVRHCECGLKGHLTQKRHIDLLSCDSTISGPSEPDARLSAPLAGLPALLRRALHRHGEAYLPRSAAARPGRASGWRRMAVQRRCGASARRTVLRDAGHATRTPLLKVFVNSLSDLFYEPIVGAGWTAEVYYEMRVCNWNIYQVLTKRPEVAAAFYAAHPEVHHLRHVWLGTS